MTPVLDYRH